MDIVAILRKNNESFESYLRALTVNDWIRLIEALLAEEFVRIPISMRDQTPVTVMVEISGVMNQYNISKVSLEEAVLKLLYASKGWQAVPKRVQGLLGIVATLRSPLFSDTLQKLILERNYQALQVDGRNLHIALINYYTTTLIYEDPGVTNHLFGLIVDSVDARLFPVALKYFRRFLSDERFSSHFMQLIFKSTTNDSRSQLLFFVGDWIRKEGYQPFCRFLDLYVTNRVKTETTLFVRLLKEYFENDVEQVGDPGCLLALNLSRMLVKEHVDANEIDFLYDCLDTQIGMERPLITLKAYVNNQHKHDLKLVFVQAQPRGLTYENLSKRYADYIPVRPASKRSHEPVFKIGLTDIVNNALTYDHIVLVRNKMIENIETSKFVALPLTN